jgi:hypothetical protein
MIRRLALAATLITASGIGITSATPAHAYPVVDCNYTVTSAGAGMQALSPNLSMPVETLQVGQVYDLFNTSTTYNNILYWNGEGFGRTGGYWFPIKNVSSGVVYMLKDQNSCTNDTD